MNTERCSCGRTDKHVIAERRTMDGSAVLGWSDGEVTFRMGIYPRGIAKTRGTYPQHNSRIRDLVLEEVCLYDASELGALIRAAREAIGQTSFPPRTYLRRRMAGEKFWSNGTIVKGKRS